MLSTGLWSLFLGFSAHAQTQGGIPRHPDLVEDTVVFTAGGDLWKAPVSGGTATRLTSHPGVESFARIHPDGTHIAYTADYQGDSNVWVIPMEGGEPTRLTWHTQWWGDDLVWDWTPDGEKVLFASRYRTPQRRFMELFAVSKDGGLPEPTPISDVGPAKMAPDGSYLFNRYFRNFRTWKRYRGGSQQDLWHYDPATGASERLTDFEGTDTHPMIAHDGTRYFVSDRPDDGGDVYATRNLFRLEADGSATKLTNHQDFDVDWPSLDDGRIIYMHGSGLRVLEIDSGEDRAIELTIPDEAHDARPRFKHVSWDQLAVGPQAKRVAVVAHGHLLTVPAKEGAWRNVHGVSDSRVLQTQWSPDGKKLAFISDASGEHEIWVVDQDGEGTPRKVTSGNDTWMQAMTWSPDSRRIAYTDKRMRLWDVSVSTGSKFLVDTGEVTEIGGVSYSRDSKLITYVKTEANGYGGIWIHSTIDKQNHRITDDFNDDFAPTFDPEGRYLYFASSRNFDLVGNVYEWRYVHRLTDFLYAVRLTEDTEDPLAFESDEEVDANGTPPIEDEEEDARDKRRAKRDNRRKKKKVVLEAPVVKLDVDGIEDRVQRLPIPAGSYGGLTATEEGLMFMSYPGLGGGPTTLKMYVLKDREVKDVQTSVYGYQLAAGGDHLLVFKSNGQVGVSPAQPKTDAFEPVSLGGLRVWVDPRQEWAHTLDEVRRYMREYFYDPGMHGHDWDALHDRYATWLQSATHLSDVHFIISEYMGELNAGHAYVRATGRNLYHDGMGFLGADLDRANGGIQITRIFTGEEGDPARSSPLRAPNIDIEEGSFLVAIDGRELKESDNPYRWLLGTAGRPVRLHVNQTPSMVGAREVTVIPASSESQLRYWDWVEERRQKVAEATEGRVGYIHVPNTSTQGYTEFVRGLYAQHRKDGLIFDVRYNSGGFIPEMFIEHLLRPHYNTWVPRDGHDWRTPQISHHGPKAAIINGYAGSGGDAFPYYFRQFDLGPLVGTTTWGGLVGINNSLTMRIGGSINAPSFAMVNREGEWDVERIGVAPDMEVYDPPEAMALGEDPQLDTTIAWILKALETWEDPVPDRPESFPVRP